ncbi:endonuclease/exonuclease/phosphatase family protein [Nocardia sp. NPDC049149]|uniref:endonuclease/exonuclease/phosphatase family protein n=1 Tax=Nocardia sp. NPDC049149 TaxID=3364315 RepID=UPI003718E60E
MLHGTTFRVNIARDTCLVSLAAVLGVLLVANPVLPDLGGVSQLVCSFLPWLLVPTLLLAALALAVRSVVGVAAVCAPLVAWSILFVPQLIDHPHAYATGTELQVTTMNLGANGTADELTDAAIVSVQELTGRNRAAVAAALDPQHPYTATVGTVGLWSRFPLTNIQPLDLGQGWPRALRAQADTPFGDITIYAAHLGSTRLGETASRNRTLRTLTDLVTQDHSPRLLILGDLNTASTDPHLTPLTVHLQEARTGLAFTWPALFPLTRPDHILTRGFTTRTATVLPTHGSDHRAPTATLTPHVSR